MANIRTKGKDGEYEIIKRLQPFFPNQLKRNLEQTRFGGSDIDGTHPFVVEVKRVEDTSLGNKNTWWKQVLKACASPHDIPVVAFRPSRQAWRYLIPSSLILPDSDEWMEVSETVFLKYTIHVFDTVNREESLGPVKPANKGAEQSCTANLPQDRSGDTTK